MTTFLLLHGGYHGAWCWRRVIDHLPARDVVHAPTFTGLAERSHLDSPEIGLDVYCTDVLNLIRWEQLDDIVLVAHSFGGIVATAVADRVPERIRAFVYLDAFVPQDGQSLVDLGWPASEPGVTPVPPPPAAIFGLSGADCEWVDSQMTPQAANTATDKVVLTGAYEAVDRTYVFATGWDSLPHFMANRDMARASENWRAYDVDGSHELMIDRPADVAHILVETAERTRGATTLPCDAGRPSDRPA
ncbi:alpha/beta fold hydrolase [Rhodococcus opacus]|uniref:alpha/beta fold hydrolase n=1 Tax=Rhodococcus opacus TaxID=37919 RepID=UPI0024BAC89B|nr:alpha/beta hydrolase family protein [Rhodococcus opacus]MDJ0418574.1 alpha/beta hydrolase family protein [Rhodococcus opacus]